MHNRRLCILVAALLLVGVSGSVCAGEAAAIVMEKEIVQLRAENNLLRATLEQRNGEIADLKMALWKLSSATVKPLEENIAVLKSRLAELEKENATLRSIKALAERGGEVKVVPLVGDETPLVKVMANPRDYIGKKFIVVGGLRVKNYYNFRYDDAEPTHVSLDLCELRADGSQTREDISLYLSRSVSKRIVDAVADAVGKGDRTKLVRAKVTILRERYADGMHLMAEMLDWQFRNAEGTGWEPWALGR